MAASGESVYHLGFTTGCQAAGVALWGTDLVRLIFGSPGAPER